MSSLRGSVVKAVLRESLSERPEIRLVACRHFKNDAQHLIRFETKVSQGKLNLMTHFVLLIVLYSRYGWQFSVAVTRWSRSTQLLYIEPS